LALLFSPAVLAEPETEQSAFSSITLRLVDWSGDPTSWPFGEGPGLMGGHLVHTSRGASLYRNLGNGKWERHASAAPDQLFGESMVMGDFDGDGHPGFATSTSVMDRHDIVNLWKPDNTWKAVDVNELRPMAYVWSVAAADFDGDGRTGLAVAYTSFEFFPPSAKSSPSLAFLNPPLPSPSSAIRPRRCTAKARS
jgi:hypothetical protein